MDYSLFMKFLLLSLLFGCAGLSSINKRQAVSSAVAGATASELVNKAVKTLPKFSAYLKIQDFEVCILGKNEGEVDCTLVLSHHKRTLPKERLFEEDSIFIKKESFLLLLSEIKAFCEADPETCKKKFEDYKTIKRVFIF